MIQKVTKSLQKSGAIICLSLAFGLMSGCAAFTETDHSHISAYSTNPFVFKLEQPVPNDGGGDGGGGVFAHELNGDGLFDFVITSQNNIAAYDHNGTKLWGISGDIKLWAHYHHPSAIAGDMDGDGRQEVAYLTTADTIKIVDGKTGAVKKTLTDIGQPTAMAIANLRAKGDRDIILQYSQTFIKAIRADNGADLWQTDQFRGTEHSPLRVADLDGDGMDEVAGTNIIDHDGTKMNSWDLGGVYKSADSIVIADIVPGYPLEVAIAEQRGANSHTDVVNSDRIVFRTLNPWNWEDPDKLAVGDFDSTRKGLEIFNRSSGGDGVCPRGKREPFADEECPWVIDARGEHICKYYINDSKPAWWTGHGLEVICRIDWDGDREDEIVGKERHKYGAGAIVNPMTGEFKKIFVCKAVRIYAADIQADYREEVITINTDGTVKIFFNDTPNDNPPKPRYWKQQHYRRQKQNWNYYSP